jgi:hypothetical protein
MKTDKVKNEEKAASSTGVVVRDETKMKGSLTITEKDAKTGKVLSSETLENMVVNNGREQLTHLVAGDGALRYVNRMQYGTGSLAVTNTQTQLQQPITPLKTVTPTYPTDYQTMFTAILGSADANGFSITEAALVAADGVMVARRVFAAKNKLADKILTFDWTLSFAS